MSSAPLCAELISTGSELLSGRTINRHAAVLGEILGTLGISLVRDTTLPDDGPSISSALADALERTSLIFISGGLGPTSDDLTREAVAAVLGVAVIPDPDAEAHITRWMTRLGRPVSEEVLRQAQVLEGAEVYPNPVGLAPGMRFERAGAHIFLLPGPPREFKGVLETHIVPFLRQLFPDAVSTEEQIFMLTGIGESDVQRRMENSGAFEGVEIGYCAAPGRVEVRLSPGGSGSLAFQSSLNAFGQQFAKHIFSTTRQSLEEVIAAGFVDQGLRLAVAESCTAGLLGAQLTSVPGSSAFFEGGVISYSNACKSRLLAVPPEMIEAHGAVSEPVACAMAAGVRAALGSDIGLSITGIAGPGGGSEAKPVGTVWVGVARASEVKAHLFQLSGNRENVRIYAVQRALDLLWRLLLR